mmetsp:Transcript_31710/g.90988  ORF Transcript_31710/g.90988 Transcript_31710/m.90988 type:complete len:156 (-) Transcript_31710:109-576(-)|eukprot:CAMPEP_0168425506 /NCGR_PEP_ID=MMETSP0228-20121227/35358_1 /TAXON_ID=133427 /ORGANISM="Protoceratium reticulatum, Strain CCCM 535 (=CCMP 1889)" /LENGTH=155 /DNA_ID=CAMNT_0008439499 /DNA_START=67 /DNA_END=534 /DNA_ORIENTATION=+
MGEKDQKDVPVFAGGLHNVAQIKIWQEILKTETQMAREWDDKWGFFKAPDRALRSERRQGGSSQGSSLAKSASVPTLSVAGREVVQPGRSVDSELGIDYINDRQRVLDRRSRMVPKERYKRPTVTSHQHGWRPSVELFGVSHHGLKRDNTIQPTM